ncbi:MAG TPA: hypothetical protein QGF08_03040 [Candidatus Marinimicrobia bacterium]|nr:hypothetical protein [Candidatus Neomarinimicrobiota bacterium]MDP7436901.1 hypothetical protein [Candidatus Neomarinimicrobiota bacterium]HJL74646.1 hypothetical protein [Candidatus Neomarinimicrobiota bacterium]HJM69840.1 hypothetical protein [Candidatus Neomarinimicrobiota bacterium]
MKKPGINKTNFSAIIFINLLVISFLQFQNIIDSYLVDNNTIVLQGTYADGLLIADLVID